MSSYRSPHSPPPLQHPIPTHPANQFTIPSPPPFSHHHHPNSNSSNTTSAKVSADYQRFASPGPPSSHSGHNPFSSGANTLDENVYGPAGGVTSAYSSSSAGAGSAAKDGLSGQMSSGPKSGWQHHPAQSNLSSGPPPPQSQQQQPDWTTFMSAGMAGLGSGNMNSATTQMGMQLGRSAFSAGEDYVNKVVPKQHLKHAFNVSNLYVANKLKIVLLPWWHYPWSRVVRRSETTGQAEGYKPPREDINSPDLYIPVMALVTYILLSGVVAGSKSQFHPELLGLTASKSLGIVLLEFLAIKLGCYLLAIGGEGTITDLVAYCGYKFVGVVICLLAGLMKIGGWWYWGIFFYAFSANGFFLLRSLRYVVLYDATQNAGNPVPHAQRGRRLQFLFGIAASQVGSMWILVR